MLKTLVACGAQWHRCRVFVVESRLPLSGGPNTRAATPSPGDGGRSSLWVWTPLHLVSRNIKNRSDTPIFIWCPDTKKNRSDTRAGGPKLGGDPPPYLYLVSRCIKNRSDTWEGGPVPGCCPPHFQSIGYDSATMAGHRPSLKLWGSCRSLGLG